VISTTRLKPSGDFLVSTVYKGQLFKRRYSGYTRKEAWQIFLHEFREHREQCKKLSNQPEKKDEPAA